MASDADDVWDEFEYSASAFTLYSSIIYYKATTVNIRRPTERNSGCPNQHFTHCNEGKNVHTIQTSRQSIDKIQ
jgi:hypothetical protein